MVLLPGSGLRFLSAFNARIPFDLDFSGSYKPFEGKYELDVLEQELGEPGRLHDGYSSGCFSIQAALSLEDTHGLEVDHVYALNLFKDAGLVLHKVEILVRKTQGGLTD